MSTLEYPRVPAVEIRRASELAAAGRIRVSGGRARGGRFSALQRLMPTCDGTTVRRCNSRSALRQVMLRDVARMEPFVPFPSEPTDAADDSDDFDDSGEAEVRLRCP